MTKLFLNTNVRLVGVQFNFSNPTIVPSTIELRRQETMAEQRKRKDRPNDGCMVIRPIDAVSIEHLVTDLESFGYQLVDAFSQERPHPKRRDQTYFTSRFIFVQEEHADVSDGFARLRDTVRAELTHICTDAFWRTTAFVNPFYKEGVAIDGVKSVNLNFSVRTPRFNPDGSSLLARQKDECGRKIGEPVPLIAEHKLIRSKKMLQIV